MVSKAYQNIAEYEEMDIPQLEALAAELGHIENAMNTKYRLIRVKHDAVMSAVRRRRNGDV